MPQCGKKNALKAKSFRFARAGVSYSYYAIIISLFPENHLLREIYTPPKKKPLGTSNKENKYYLHALFK